ncbi:hypothetical protein HYW60_02875 [Candidatus Kaiserbacteria bacterium]|nr:hypothetical protein [Candidatus Kaiserbacteria bacterium]
MEGPERNRRVPRTLEDMQREDEAIEKAEKARKRAPETPPPTEPTPEPQPQPRDFNEVMQGFAEEARRRGEGGTRGAEAPQGGGDIYTDTSLNAPAGGGFDWRKVDQLRYEGVPLKGVREILADKRDSQLFNEYFLTSLRPPEVRGGLEGLKLRYAEERPEPEDMKFMGAAADEFSYRLHLAEQKKLEVADVELLARRGDSFFATLVKHEGYGQEGLKRATEIANSAILYNAMTKPDGAQKFLADLQSLSRNRDSSRYKESEARRQEIGKSVGVSVRDYEKVFRLDTEANRRASKDYLEKKIHEQAGKFRRMLDWMDSDNPEIGRKFVRLPGSLPGSSRWAAERAVQKAELAGKDYTYHLSLSNALKTIDTNLKDIATYLGPAINKPEVRTLIAREALTNQNQRLASEGGPESFEQVQQLSRGACSQQSIEQRIRERMRERDWPKGNTPDDIAAQNSIVRDMARAERHEYAGGGFFAWLFGMLFGQNWNKAANGALGRPIRI